MPCGSFGASVGRTCGDVTVDGFVEGLGAMVAFDFVIVIAAAVAAALLLHVLLLLSDVTMAGLVLLEENVIRLFAIAVLSSYFRLLLLVSLLQQLLITSISVDRADMSHANDVDGTTASNVLESSLIKSLPLHIDAVSLMYLRPILYLTLRSRFSVGICCAISVDAAAATVAVTVPTIGSAELQRSRTLSTVPSELA